MIEVTRISALTSIALPAFVSRESAQIEKRFCCVAWGSAGVPPELSGMPLPAHLAGAHLAGLNTQIMKIRQATQLRIVLAAELFQHDRHVALILQGEDVRHRRVTAKIGMHQRRALRHADHFQAPMPAL